MILSSLVTLRRPTEHVPSPEDFFSDTIGSLFPDDLQNQHGDNPSTIIVYKNTIHGELEFKTADVNGEEERRKFAHYLWNAGVLMGELIGGRPIEQSIGDEKENDWSIQDETVLELGAGVGLGGIMSVLSGASEVAITDYPAPSILDTIKNNVAKNVPEAIRSKVTVEGHVWGSSTTPFEMAHAHRYTRILAADCLWMLGEHENLAKSMLHFLSHSSHTRILCIAGFHTGRAKVAPFFEEVLSQNGLAIEEIYEMKADGQRRPWAKERDGGREDIGERKKWLVVARIKRK
ncbi:putative methyltransferase-domain-containing protein [Phaeosphaeriaceae sp. PMI808]|nr:putative methyltransferase-domain-containing protein [Phaeosphaeriaceae sp. PMI808]